MVPLDFLSSDSNDALLDDERAEEESGKLRVRVATFAVSQDADRHIGMMEHEIARRLERQGALELAEEERRESRWSAVHLRTNKPRSPATEVLV